MGNRKKIYIFPSRLKHRGILMNDIKRNIDYTSRILAFIFGQGIFWMVYGWFAMNNSIIVLTGAITAVSSLMAFILCYSAYKQVAKLNLPRV